MPFNEEEIYQEHVLDHYECPYHRGHCPAATHSHADDNPLCGDFVQVELRIGDDGKIEDAFFDGDGCCISQASASMLMERIHGKTVAEAKEFSADDMLTLFGARLTPNRQKCCLLPCARAADGRVFVSGESHGRQGIVMTTVPASLAFDPEALRRDFPILAADIHQDTPLVYLDNAATTQRPRQVIESIKETSERHYANVHRGIHALSERSTDMFESAREKVRGFINAETIEQVIFTHGATESVNLVARSWGDANLVAGDEILLTEMEHHANIVPWRQLAQRTGAELRYLPITDDGLLCLDKLPELITPRTRLVAVTAVSNVLGTINPVAEIVSAAHAAGALALIDAAQSAPHQPLDVQALDADFVAFSGHKMLGPSGVGVLYGRREVLEAMPPFMGGGGMIRRVTLEGFEPAELPAKFEAGTPPIVAAIGLGVAIDYLQRVGLDAIHQHEQRLAAQAHEVLDDVGGIRRLGPEPDKKAGIVSFVVEGVHAHDVAQRLDHHGVAVRAGHHCTMPLHRRLKISASSRASFYLYNTLAEVETLGEALRETKAFFGRGRR